MEPYQFAFHDGVSSTPPPNANFDLVKSGKKLTRGQKDSIFHYLQGNTDRGHYRLMGWAFPFSEYMNTYLVKYKHNGWLEVQAFDKTCIRNSWYTNSCIIRIVQLD